MRAAARVAQVRALLTREGLDGIIVRSTTDLQWLTGFEGVFDTEEAHTALITQERCIIHTDSRYSTAMGHAAAAEGLWQVSFEREGAAAFAARVAKEEGIDQGRIIIDTSTPLRLYRDYVRELPDVGFAERSGDILKLRSVKDAEEIERMKAAQRVADEAFLATLEGMRPGQTEAEVSLALEFAMRERGAQELAFANIVASGPNSASPHAQPGQRKLQAGDFVVIDFGARVNGYRSDTTRTLCVGEPSELQRRMYAAALEANREVRAAVKPGMTGIMMQDLAEGILEEAGFGGKMGHGLGHGVGLDIHEEPCLNSRNHEPLPAGAVVTVEPGVYLPGVAGVRIEDCGVLTEDGFQNFCSLDHELICI